MDKKDILNKRVKVLDDLIIRKNDQTTLAYNEKTGDLYEFNETSEIIIDKLKKHISLSHIYNELCNEYDESEETILYDLEVIINQLTSLGVLQDI